MPLSLPFCQVRIAVLEFIVRTYPWTDFHQASLFVPRHWMGCLVLLELRFPIALDVMAPHPLLHPPRQVAQPCIRITWEPPLAISLAHHLPWFHGSPGSLRPGRFTSPVNLIFWQDGQWP